MKRTIKYSLLPAILMPALTGCLEEAIPTSGMTQNQVETISKDPLVDAITKYMTTVTSASTEYYDIGYPGLMITRDVMTADMPVADIGYWYFDTYGSCLYCGDWYPQSTYWGYYYSLIQTANIAIKACDKESKEDAPNLATAYAYRVMAYMDMTRLYEFRPTGTSLDARYDEIKGLTVPLVNEHTTEASARNNPRAPFYKMYRFMMTDLDNAEAAIGKSSASQPKNKASKGVIYGLKARLWLEIATRFDRYPEDLATMLEHESDSYDKPEDLGEGYALNPLGITTANDAYRKAAEYARKAINAGYTPLSKSEWFDINTGFNTANNSWMLGIMISSSDEMVTYYVWQSWPSFMCPEANYGVAGPTYKATHLIDANLFSKIGAKDWRRYTWIDPADQEAGEEAFKAKYAANTSFSYKEWSKMPAYSGLKFRPGSGERSSSTTGNKVDIPLMRVEEMYFIEAEAKAHTDGVGAGKSLLESFMNTYRYEGGSYTCRASSIDDFAREVVLQKRIELWGEGHSIFDIRRLGIAVERGYEGSNHIEDYRFNSLEGYVPAWSTLYIPMRESGLNKGVVLNPDPSSTTTSECKWK